MQLRALRQECEGACARYMGVRKIGPQATLLDGIVPHAVFAGKDEGRVAQMVRAALTDGTELEEFGTA